MSDHVTTVQGVRETINALSNLERPLTELRDRTVAATEGMVRLTAMVDGAVAAGKSEASSPSFFERLLRVNRP